MLTPRCTFFKNWESQDCAVIQIFAQKFKKKNPQSMMFCILDFRGIYCYCMDVYNYHKTTSITITEHWFKHTIYIYLLRQHHIPHHMYCVVKVCCLILELQ